MTKQSHSRKAAAPGLKLVMTAAALAGTLVGWAGFARDEQTSAQSPSTKALVQSSPLPTLIAPPSVFGSPMPGGPVAAAPSLRRVNSPAGSVGGAAAAPAGAAAPVTVTQSSR